MLTETVLCKIFSRLAGKDIYELKSLDPSAHLQPILLDLDHSYFGPYFNEQRSNWNVIISETEKFMSLNGIEGGLDYDQNENLLDPSEQFIFTVVVQILAVYWLYSSRLDEVLKEMDTDDYQAFSDAVLPFKNSLSEALAKNYANLTKERKSFNQNESMQLVVMQREIKTLTNTVSLQKKTISDLEARTLFLNKTVDDRDKEIKALKEIEDILVTEKNTMINQRMKMTNDYEKLLTEHNKLHERFIRQEDDNYKTLSMVEQLEHNAKDFKNQELFYQSQKKTFEEVNNKLKTLEDLKADYEFVKAANEDKKQFIMILHGKNKELQTQIVDEMQKIINLEGRNAQLEGNAQNLQSNIVVLENQIKTLKNENAIYKNYNRNLLTKDYMNDDTNQSETNRTRTEKSFGMDGDKTRQLNKKINELKNENSRLRANFEQSKQREDEFLRVVEENAQIKIELDNLRKLIKDKDRELESRTKLPGQKVVDTETENKLRSLLSDKDEKIQELSEKLKNLARQLELDKQQVLNKQKVFKKFSFSLLNVESKKPIQNNKANSFDSKGLQTDIDLLDLFEFDSFSVLYSAFACYTSSYLDVNGQRIIKNLEAKKQLGTHFSVGKMLLNN